MTSVAPPESPRRRPKGDKRARTRSRLIEVAAQLVEEKGYDGMTLQEVARRAGMSNGAIYGNFRNREDLLAAIGPTYWPQVRPRTAPGASVAETLRGVAEALIAVMPGPDAQGGFGRRRGLAYGLGQRRALTAHSARTAPPRATPRRSGGGASGSLTRPGYPCRRRTWFGWSAP